MAQQEAVQKARMSVSKIKEKDGAVSVNMTTAAILHYQDGEWNEAQAAALIAIAVLLGVERG